MRARRAEAAARLQSSQKSVASVPAYLRFVNRKAGGQLATVAYAVGLTPTQVTILSSISSGLGIAALALLRPSLGVGLAVALLLALGYALDSADGQLARVRGGGTSAGEWLDHVADIAKITSLHGAVILSGLVHVADPDPAWLAVPIAFLVANVTMFFGMMLRDQLAVRAGAARPVQGTDTSVLKSVALLPIDYGTLCWCFALLSYTTTFRVGYGLLALCACLFAARSLVRAYRALSELDAAPRAA